MPKNKETDILYVLHRADGTVFAEMMMTPSMAASINRRRRERGINKGDWEPQPLKEYGLWHLDTEDLIQVEVMSQDRAKLFNKAFPKTFPLRWVETNQAALPEGK